MAAQPEKNPVRVDFVVLASHHGCGSTSFINLLWKSVVATGQRCAVNIFEPFDTGPRDRLIARAAHPSEGLYFANGTLTGSILFQYVNRTLAGLNALGRLANSLGSHSPCRGLGPGGKPRLAFSQPAVRNKIISQLLRVPAQAVQRAAGEYDVVLGFFSELRRVVCAIFNQPDCVLVHKIFPETLGDIYNKPRSLEAAYAHAFPYLVHPRTLTVQLERLNETARQMSNFRRFSPHAKHGAAPAFILRNPRTWAGHGPRDKWATLVQMTAGMDLRVGAQRYAYVTAESYFANSSHLPHAIETLLQQL